MEFKIYTVSFFGHRFIEVNKQAEIEKELDKLITDLISQNKYVEFLVGYGGDFNTLVSSSIRRTSKNCYEYNFTHILILPYMRAVYKNNIESFMNFYDEIEICEESSAVHPKRAIEVCNKNIVMRSDLAIFFIDRKQGGAYNTYKYAQKKNIKTINLGALI
ncbi:MAG: hypothetical protein IKK37_08225 [Clostridia bacterium]|nr:hypothetical protein [Clostridia bacterium]